MRYSKPVHRSRPVRVVPITQKPPMADDPTPRDRPPTAEDNKNRFLRETMKHLAKLRRIVESQEPGRQEPVQGQFDELVQQFEVVHAAMVERGFLPTGKLADPHDA